MSLFNIYQVFLHRVGDIEFSPDAPDLHPPFTSLLVAIPQFMGEFAGLNTHISVPGILIGQHQRKPKKNSALTTIT
jgi:hypothetical protein